MPMRRAVSLGGRLGAGNSFRMSFSLLEAGCAIRPTIHTPSGDEAVTVHPASVVFQQKRSMQLTQSRFDGRRFHNEKPRQHGFRELLRWLMSRQPGPWHNWIDEPAGPPPPQHSQRLRITFVNHTTFLLQLDGINLLTDPVWSERASPLSWIGPRRHRRRHPLRGPAAYRRGAAQPRSLRSHGYSHAQRLARVHRPVVYTGLGNAATLAKHRISKVVELDWWGTAASTG